MQENNAVWMWSETFLESVQRVIGDPPPQDKAEVRNWHKHSERLVQWRHEVKEARTEYQQERPALLRELYNFWRNTGLEDAQEQAMLARDTFPRLRLSRRLQAQADANATLVF
jgi:hypothetical protein